MKEISTAAMQPVRRLQRRCGLANGTSKVRFVAVVLGVMVGVPLAAQAGPRLGASITGGYADLSRMDELMPFAEGVMPLTLGDGAFPDEGAGAVVEGTVFLAWPAGFRIGVGARRGSQRFDLPRSLAPGAVVEGERLQHRSVFLEPRFSFLSGRSIRPFLAGRVGRVWLLAEPISRVTFETVSQGPFERVDRGLLDVDGWELGGVAGVEVWATRRLGLEFAAQASTLSFDQARAELANMTGPLGGDPMGTELVKAMIEGGTGLYVSFRAGLIVTLD